MRRPATHKSSVARKSPLLALAVVLALAGASHRIGAQTLYVFPHGSSVVKPPNSSSQTANFGLSGLVTGQTYFREIYCTGQVFNCGSTTPQSFTAPLSSINVTYFTTATSGTGRVLLKVYASGMTPKDTGWYNVTVDAPPQVRLLAPTTGSSAEYPTIQLAWCDDIGLNSGSRSITVNGVDRTTSFTHATGGPADCPNASTSTTSTVPLVIGSNTVVGYICDSFAQCTQSTFTLARTPRRVAVRPEFPERQQFVGTSGSQRIFVKSIAPATTSLTVGVTCTGTASGCSVTPTTLFTVRPGESRVVTLSYSVAAGAVGSATVKAFDATNADSAAVTLTPVNAPYPVVSLTDVNPGTAVERGSCVTVSTGPGTAFECGDLRVVHPLPGIRTLSKARVPVLLYNSAHADAYPIVAANVTLASTSGAPDAVEAVLKVNGVEKARGQWAGADWTPGSTRRIAVGYSAMGDTTNVYDYTLEVATIYATTRNATVASGKLIVVNRRNGGFGAGWWLAGLERLELRADGSKLWVGGDGSARLYSPKSSNTWLAPSVDGPDTLSWDGTNYVRSISGGVKVRFNSTGQHVATVNRLGHRTSFGYTNNLFTSITLPAAGGGQAYNFVYDGNSQLSTVIAPGARTTTVTITSGRVDAVRDIDNRAITFTYEDAASRRISSRTDKRLTTTVFSYDAAQKLSRAKTDLQPDSVRLGFAAIDARGLLTANPKTAVNPDSAYTIIYGARSYATLAAERVIQETRLSLDQFGAPRRVRDAEGNITTIKREDGEWPALVTEATNPAVFIVRAGYDGRGNIARSSAINPYGDGRDAETRYHWNQTWDAVDSIVTPTGLTTTIGYDATNGGRLWQQTGDASRRVNFTYYAAGDTAGLLKSVIAPGTPPAADTLFYDAMGNPSAYKTPRGFLAQTFNDALGRPYETRQQVDISGTTRMQKVATTYDVMSRDSTTKTGTLVATEPSVTVVRTRDRAGNDSVITRVISPDPAGIGNMVTLTIRDALGRVVKSIAPDDRADSTVYDQAGNVVKTFNRNGDALRKPDSVVFAYDALNRLRRRATPSLFFPAEDIGLARGRLQWPDPVEAAVNGEGMSQSYPWGHPNGYDIPAAADTFIYHPTNGSLTDANNDFAQVHFDYYPNGQLRVEQNTQRPWDWGTGASHTYRDSITYDLDARRITLKYPSAISPTGGDTVRYAYSPLGDLQTVTDLVNVVTTFTVDSRGQLLGRNMPGPSSQAYTYDDDGNLTSDTVRVMNWSQLRQHRFSNDARGKRTDMTDITPSGYRYASDANTYNTIGQLSSSTHQFECCSATSSYDLDALGNVIKRSGADASIGYANDGGFSRTTTSNNGVEWQFYLPRTGRLWYTKIVPNPDTTGQVQGGGGRPASMNWYDGSGNQIWTGAALLRLDGFKADAQSERRMYYGPDGKLRAVDARALHKKPDAPAETGAPGFSQSFEEYRYDALGRRVATRFDQKCDYYIEYNTYNAPCHLNGIRRTIWDGNQELGEIQLPADQLENDTYFGQGTLTASSINLAPHYGAVAYIYDGKIDRPLEVTRLRYSNLTPSNTISQLGAFTFAPMWDVHGQVSMVAPMGALPAAVCASDVAGGQKVTCISWVLQQNWLPSRDVSTMWARAWQGTLVQDKIGAGGLMYRRNRYYDSKTGRFTQEDPIGLAGGLNAYGYANGDPVNYSDPFGLCPWYLRFSSYCEGYDSLRPAEQAAVRKVGFFRAKKAKSIFNEAVAVANAQFPVPAGHKQSDGLNDAYKHAYGSCRMTQETDATSAEILGDAHENVAGNRDASRRMDIHNNAIGRSIGSVKGVNCAAEVRTAAEFGFLLVAPAGKLEPSSLESEP